MHFSIFVLIQTDSSRIVWFRTHDYEALNSKTGHTGIVFSLDFPPGRDIVAKLGPHQVEMQEYLPLICLALTPASIEHQNLETTFVASQRETV